MDYSRGSSGDYGSFTPSYHSMVWFLALEALYHIAMNQTSFHTDNNIRNRANAHDRSSSSSATGKVLFHSPAAAAAGRGNRTRAPSTANRPLSRGLSPASNSCRNSRFRRGGRRATAAAAAEAADDDLRSSSSGRTRTGAAATSSEEAAAQEHTRRHNSKEQVRKLCEVHTECDRTHVRMG